MITTVLTLIKEVAAAQPTQFLIAAVLSLAIIAGVILFAIQIGGPDLLTQVAKPIADGSNKIAGAVIDLKDSVGVLTTQVSALQNAVDTLTRRMEQVEEALKPPSNDDE